MKGPLKRRRQHSRIVCPICGNRTTFVVYTAVIRAHHLVQPDAGKWRAARPDPHRFDARMPLLLVCAGCTHPLGAVPASVLKAVPRPR